MPNMNNHTNMALLLGGFSSFTIAAVHVATIIGGQAWYRFLGAGEEMATMAEQGSWMPAIVTLGIAIMFFIWGLYALSGAGKLKRLPLLKQTLIVISAIYLIRGLGLVVPLFNTNEHSAEFMILTSLIIQ